MIDRFDPGPCVVIERWTASDGYPCYRSFLVGGDTNPAITYAQFETYSAAWDAAQRHGAAIGVPVFSMTEPEDHLAFSR